MKSFLVCCGLAAIMFVNAANAKPYVALKAGIADFVIDTNQYMYQSPDAYKSTIVDAVIDDINAAYRAAIGYDFGNVRIDAEYGYGRYRMSGDWALNTPNGVPGALPLHLSYPATYTLKNRVSTFTANLHYNLFSFGRKYRNSLYTDINTPLAISRNSFYVTGSLGMAHISDDANVSINTTMAWGGDVLRESMGISRDRFIYGLGAGVELAITCDLYADIAYKYTDLGKYNNDTMRRDYSMHEITVGLRFEF
ncbi:MAG: outer membrane beta-barrel protein [Alphaproteobacteria bacterium]|nr:outer membrane beta-barrel protein [Alphaproteobacteria bacterium]